MFVGGDSLDRIVEVFNTRRVAVRNHLLDACSWLGVRNRCRLITMAHGTGLVDWREPDSQAVLVLPLRQKQILRGLAEGFSNAEIAAALYLSEDTVKTHIRRLFKSLAAGDRWQAVGLGYRYGCLRPWTVSEVADRDASVLGSALTRRELDWLENLAQGHDIQRPAVYSGMDFSQVMAHMHVVRDCLGCATDAGAVGMACRLGLIPVFRLQERQPVQLPPHVIRILNGLARDLSADAATIGADVGHGDGDRSITMLLNQMGAQNCAHAVALAYQWRLLPLQLTDLDRTYLRAQLGLLDKEPSTQAGLSWQERFVLEQLASGTQVKEIRRRPEISQAEVAAALARLKRRLGQTVLVALVAAAYQKGLLPVLSLADRKLVKLSRFQLAYLEAAARGEAVLETAARLQVRPNSVSVGVMRACRVLGARNRQHAVALCYQHGYLKLDEAALAGGPAA
jgi:DNA-binding NarL/FixJ family response regulator